MSDTENRILSILRPGEMLRFVLIKDGERKIDFGIEGSSESAADNDLLAERLSLVLNDLRSCGYSFGKRLRSLQPRKGMQCSRSRKPRSPAWVEIRPRTLIGIPTKSDTLGFSPAAERSTVQSLRMPDFPPSPRGTTLDSLPMLVTALRQIELFEIEFIQMTLPESAAKHLEEALRLQTITQRAITQFDQATLSQVFLAYWLWHRTGWYITVRARFRNAGDIPVASLEMIGRDLFMSECEVITTVNPDATKNTFDMRNAYPRGWPFPSIFPPPSAFGTLAASRLHNASLPELPKKGLKIGVADGVDVKLPLESRDRHTCVVGGTGTGKTTLFARMIGEDLKRNEGVIVIDPHGGLCQAAAHLVPEFRKKEVFSIDPSNVKHIPGLNILDIPQSPMRRRHAAFIVGELFRFFEEVWNMREAGGPMFEMYFRNTLLLLCLQKRTARKTVKPTGSNTDLSDEKVEATVRRIFGEDAKITIEGPATPECIKPPAHQPIAERPLSLKDFSRVFGDQKFRKELLEHCTEPSVVHFWTDIAERACDEARLSNIAPYIVSKINSLIQTGYVSDLLCAEHNEFRIAERMNRGEIMLFNLNKGLLGGYESKLLGTILMMEVFAAGLQRSLLPESKRRPVNIYVDEFQNFVSDNMASMISEARKFGLRIHIGHQNLSQLKASAGRQDLLETILGNVGNLILFRLGVPDAERLKLFIEPYTRQEMQELPNFHALVRLLTPHGPVRPLIMKTLKP
jgi:hypothetical protein